MWWASIQGIPRCWTEIRTGALTLMLTLPPIKNQLVNYYYIPMLLSNKTRQQQKKICVTQIMLVFIHFTYIA